ncbi:hemerythrin domain-containing protein [Porphyrobacter sp. ULC335]|uniref:hemerythrin domain-containing protein n=1 Tax=Porphyrobacter sp. ULC335 TaxID=2854260 RepID=UPI002220A9D5|nr:hemerythrin domain-containing protein [Porphyrobacter sp. ULC335]UYV15754.1 hemerythrin domain-containing protein [Porphyrobacter sp. ULC335]
MPRTQFRKSRSREATTTTSVIASAAKSVLVTAGVAALANIGRKIVTQAPTAMASDWCEGLIREHEATLAALDKLAAISAEHPQRRAVQLTMLKQLITKHALEEENVVYPMLRRGGDGDAVGDLHKDHGEVKAMLYELSQMDKADPAFDVTLEGLRSSLQEHMRQEEEVLFPALRAQLSDEENRKLTRTMNMAGVMVA